MNTNTGQPKPGAVLKFLVCMPDMAGAGGEATAGPLRKCCSRSSAKSCTHPTITYLSNYYWFKTFMILPFPATFQDPLENKVFNHPLSSIICRIKMVESL